MFKSIFNIDFSAYSKITSVFHLRMFREENLIIFGTLRGQTSLGKTNKNY